MPTTQVTPTADVLLQGIADALFKARKVVVITGAGISTNSGIPDFRSENGLYSLIQAQFDAASRDDTAEPRRLSANVCTNDREPPIKRRRLSFEDSGICLHSEDSQSQETSGSGDERTVSEAERYGSVAVRSSTASKRLQTDNQQPESSAAGSSHRGNTPTRSERSLRRSRRAQSLPPEESPKGDSQPPQHYPRAETRRRAVSPSRSFLRTRLRSASPDPRRKPNAYQAHSAELRKRSLLTSSLVSRQAAEHGDPLSFASSPLKPCQIWSKDGPEDAPPLADTASKTVAQTAAQISTPKASEFDCFAQSNLSRPPLTFSSSPLSSPPPVLFDPFEERSSSTSRQSSSTASSAASSETDETPPSSNPNKSTLPNIKGRDLFDASIWADPLRTSVFYTFATTLRQKVKDVQPTASHHFIGHLRNRGKLVRCYTQNIDQIEEKVGLSTSLQEGPGHRGRFSRRSTAATLAPTNLPSSDEAPTGSGESREESKGLTKPEEAGGVEGCETSVLSESQAQRQDKKSSGVECVFLHGSLESLRCFLCGKICAWDEEGRANETMSGRQPECPYCAGATAARQERGKRALGVGKLRPDIVLYGEEHPSAHLISPIVTHDLGLCPDLLLILGTSLKVHGLKVLVREFAKTIHSRGGKVVFVNYTKPPESSWGDIIDYWVQWDCDAWVSNLKERVPLLWLPPGTKLPKKKKEISEKSKKRQSTADEKSKQDAPKTSDNAASTLPPEVIVKAEKSDPPTEVPEKSDEPKKALESQQQEAELATSDIDLASATVKDEPARKERAKQKPKPTEEALPKPPPQRPMAVRDDKTSAAWLTWKVRAELRRITGNQIPAPSSPTAPRVTKPRPKRSRKSAPAALPRPTQLNTCNDAPNLRSDILDQPTSVAQEKTDDKQAQSESAAAVDVAMAVAEENSILAAVKLNPRKRKRKTIDGVEVSFTGTPRSAPAAKALPRPTAQQVKTPHSKAKPLVVSPKILSDIQRVSLDSLILPPLQMNQAPEATPSKPPPLEPIHSPTGPLTEISPNTQIRVQQRPTEPFFYCDALINKLVRAPEWTPLRGLGPVKPKNSQSAKEAEAAMALEGLKKGSGQAMFGGFL
ncbi:Hst3 protein [Colletotrichum truncatum]|uniref:Hst3 protein n=1 Tax=Colletotrichum truncatum TaxID=5467 RepID=A0ACC3ZLJ6_COLTU